MLTRSYYPAGLDASRHLVKFYARVAIGAAGAVGTTSGKGLTIAKSATGRYSITVTGNSGLGKVLYANVKVVSATNQVTWVRSITESTGVVLVSVGTAAAPTVEADPGNGDHLLIEVIVRNKASENS